jgi:GNAT superfamily N-acetyltransferase
MAAPDDPPFPFSDLALARRLERAEARANARFVEARAAVFPGSGAQWIEVAGAYAMFDTPSSPVTQTFGLGLFDPVTHAEMEALEGFFRAHGAPVFHEVSPMADPALLTLLKARGYRPVELTSVLYRPIHKDVSLAASRNARISVRPVRAEEQDLWADIAVRGWREAGDFTDFMREVAQISARRADTLSFFAEVDGTPVATGVLTLGEGIALLAGACTVPEARRQGAQLALLAHRLRHAAGQGCDLAMMGAHPGSASQRNAERHGFRIAYTRIKWGLA